MPRSGRMQEEDAVRSLEGEALQGKDMRSPLSIGGNSLGSLSVFSLFFHLTLESNFHLSSEQRGAGFWFVCVCVFSYHFLSIDAKAILHILTHP